MGVNKIGILLTTFIAGLLTKYGFEKIGQQILIYLIFNVLTGAGAAQLFFNLIFGFSSLFQCITSYNCFGKKTVLPLKKIFSLNAINAVPSSSVMKAFQENWVVLSDTAQFTIPSDNPRRTIDYIMGYTPKGYKYSDFL